MTVTIYCISISSVIVSKEGFISNRCVASERINITVFVQSTGIISFFIILIVEAILLVSKLSCKNVDTESELRRNTGMVCLVIDPSGHCYSKSKCLRFAFFKNQICGNDVTESVYRGVGSACTKAVVKVSGK